MTQSPATAPTRQATSAIHGSKWPLLLRIPAPMTGTSSGTGSPMPVRIIVTVMTKYSYLGRKSSIENHRQKPRTSSRPIGDPSQPDLANHSHFKMGHGK